MMTRRTRWLLVGLVGLLVWRGAAYSQSPEIKDAFRRFGEFYGQGRYQEALPFAKKALELGKREFGVQHPTTGALHITLAQLYFAQGRYGEAEPLYQRAVAIVEKALGREHSIVATSLNGLALLYHAQGRYAESESLHERARAIWEKALGPEHPDVAASLNNLAELYPPKANSPRPSRSISARSQSGRRPLGPSTWTWPKASRITPACSEQRDVTRRQSNSRPAPRRSGRSVHNRSPRGGTRAPGPSVRATAIHFAVMAGTRTIPGVASPA